MISMRRASGFLLIIFLQMAPAAFAQKFTFKNPILENGADPWMTKKDSLFYYCYSEGNAVRVRAARFAHDMDEGREITSWSPPEGKAYSKELWAPELHFLQGKWYIYVAADNGQNEHHRMYVLQSRTAEISSGFEMAGELQTEKWAIDGTPLELGGKLYFIWSGWAGDANEAQNLYIAPMQSPVQVSAGRVLISKPEYEWEKRGSGNGLPTINEGPQVLQHDGKTFVIYSAAGSWSDYYCLGQLQLTGTDPMDPASWTKKPEPAFESARRVYSPGHASFLNIKGQDWIIYHSAKTKGSGWKRKVNMQPFSWKHGEPHFGKPVRVKKKLIISY
ncbi:glycoside hydrolase family 43 protein [Dyadobacter sandarakinus]|uniref:Glycoside hydrolase family 43 protein n=1 Tax=Dyadobacter sandarakinus TaxID=2747268 RepID=A0ABX7I6C3_9BACT|nr:glycoside hydrolase family 43 protein [Dyadobacter sandarakinus]QRR01273.1 glycoside hydrolase family 43 protein [Dyadobacter sandarakinus]